MNDHEPNDARGTTTPGLPIEEPVVCGCGGEVKVSKMHITHEGYFFTAHCTRCHFMTTNRCKTEAEARAAFRRATRAELPAEVERLVRVARRAFTLLHSGMPNFATRRRSIDALESSQIMNELFDALHAFDSVDQSDTDSRMEAGL